MGKIQELSEQLANQIAAGEVIERPASVVKELVENAIDAHSTKITVQLKEAGINAIRVIDNGDGIENDDVALAFKRHATSKIQSRRDLFRVQTLGFRGEALPSIASVSRLTLMTATKDAKAGRKIYLEGGVIKEETAFSLRQGTDIIVENLFYNTPARLKYMKSLRTELSRIGDMMNRLALSHPEIAFQLDNDGNIVMKTIGNGDLKQTIAQIYRMEVAKKMVPIKGESLDFKISGYVSLPEETRARRQYISLILNGRYIHNYELVNAIIEGYGSKLMVGRFPIAVIQIELDPLLVDVNVHPTKQEVRLSKEDELKQLIKEAIAKALGAERLIPDALDHWKKKEKTTAVQQSFDFTTDDKASVSLTPTEQISLDEEVDVIAAALDHQEKAYEVPTDIDRFAGETIQEEPRNEMDEPVVNDKPRFPQLEYFGQMHGTYLFAQGEDGLYIIDQHAAQERIKYEYYRVAIGNVGSEQQQLMVPLTFDFPIDESLKITEGRAELEAVGIFLEPFGQQTFILHSHPTWMVDDIEQTVRDLLEIFLHKGQIDLAKFREETAIMMSCKRSIKANHHLDDRQARQLLYDLSQCENPFNCPHGRPVVIHFSPTDIEKMFKRIQDPH